MHKMPHLGNDQQLVLSLHLANHQLLIQPVSAGQDEQLAAGGLEELSAEADEPALPEGLRRGQVRAPAPGAGGAVGGVDEERGDRDGGGGRVADGARAEVPLDARRERCEGGGPRGEVCLHALQRINGGA